MENNYKWEQLIEELDLIELDNNISFENFSLEQEEICG